MNSSLTSKRFTKIAALSKMTAKSSYDKRLYLLNEKEFRLELSWYLFCFSIFFGFCATIWEEQLYDIYHIIMNRMVLDLAHSFAWWSLLGLLSSSCCVIQILLNVMSFGCAGFNNLLGPWRAVFLSITLMLQAVTWYIRTTVSPFQPKRISYSDSILSTLLVLALSLLPEALALYGVLSNIRNNKKKRVILKTNQEKAEHATIGNSDDQEMMKNYTTLNFVMENVGCSACITTVAGVMNSILTKKEDGFFTTSPSNSSLTVVLHEKNKETLQKHIVQKLDEAGFPVELVKK